jgi:hypothetical protein
MAHMPRKSRVALSSEALQILKIWATLENKAADEKLSELVISSAPQKVRNLVKPDISRVEEPEVPRPKISEVRKPLRDNPEAQARIMEMKAEDKTFVEISKVTGYPATTIRDFVARKTEGKRKRSMKH